MSYGEAFIAAHVSEKFKVRMDTLARRLGVSRSELLRRAIEEYVERAEQKN